MVSSAVGFSSSSRSRRRHAGSPTFWARRLARSRSLMTWSRSTSPPSLTGSSSSSSSISSDSGFSLICAGGPAGIGRPELKSDRMTTAMLRARFVNRCQFARHTPHWIRTHVSVDQVVHLEDGQQHCKNDAHDEQAHEDDEHRTQEPHERRQDRVELTLDRKSTRLNSSHRCISYAVFCLKKKNKNIYE